MMSTEGNRKSSFGKGADASDTKRFGHADSDVDYGNVTLVSRFDAAVERFANNTCIHFVGRTYSYRDIGNLVNKAAVGFRDLGVGPGVRVGLCVPNSPYSVICYYAILKAGGTVVNFNPLYAEREVAELAETSQVEIMVTLDLRQIYPKVAALLNNSPVRSIVVCRMRNILPTLKGFLFSLFEREKIVVPQVGISCTEFDRLIDNDGSIEAPKIDPSGDIAVLQFTGGTTGRPKAAMLSHRNLLANADQVGCRVGDIRDGKERVMGVLPLSHVFGMTLIMNLGIAAGAELVLLPRFELEQFLRTIEDRRITFLIGVPTIFTAVTDCKNLDSYDFSSLKYCVSGGAPLLPAVKQRLENRAGCKLVEGYGLTECSPVVACNSPLGVPKEGSVGPALPNTVIEIRDLDGSGGFLPPGEKGEVCVMGPQLMAGYYERPEETESTIVDGRLHTGDVGYLDEDGYLFLVDRIKDLILCGGYNVYPSVVEGVISEHPAVLEVAVIGVPDDYRGQTLKAFVRLKNGYAMTVVELREFLRDKLSPIEMPAHIEFRDTLPKTEVGKLSKKALAEGG